MCCGRLLCVCRKRMCACARYVSGKNIEDEGTRMRYSFPCICICDCIQCIVHTQRGLKIYFSRSARKLCWCTYEKKNGKNKHFFTFAIYVCVCMLAGVFLGVLLCMYAGEFGFFFFIIFSMWFVVCCFLGF